MAIKQNKIKRLIVATLRHLNRFVICRHFGWTGFGDGRESCAGKSSGSSARTRLGLHRWQQGKRQDVLRHENLRQPLPFQHQLITGVLRWRANSSPDHVLYTLLNSKGAIAKTLTCSELHKRAEKIAALLQERGKVNPSDHVGEFLFITGFTWHSSLPF